MAILNYLPVSYLSLLMEGTATLEVGEGSRGESVESEDGLDVPDGLGATWL